MQADAAGMKVEVRTQASNLCRFGTPKTEFASRPTGGDRDL